MYEEDEPSARGQLAADFSVGEMARRSGVAVSALHFYESKGLIRSRRTAGNQRRYARDMLRRVSVIKAAQRIGMPLADIAAALRALPDSRTPTARDWDRMARAWKDDLNDRIARMELLRDRLSGCIGCGCLSMKRCPLVNPADTLAECGDGPRYLAPGTRYPSEP
jgi:MerR family redox-sensitive transcriptional activator SoxR